MSAGYSTNSGKCLCGDSMNLLQKLDDESIDLVLTSPPFSLQRQKEYGNISQAEYVSWLCNFCRMIYDKLKPSGSLVLDVGGAYEKGQPVYSLYQFRLLIALCDELGYMLAQPFYWHNPGALPAPVEWVNKRKLRAKNSVNTIWWLCKTPYCKADVSQVLTPYSQRMKRMINYPEEFVKDEGTHRPSGHILGLSSWTKNNGGAIPPNMLNISNTESNSQYLRFCRTLGIKPHPARFPAGLPEFFIKMLTDEGDFVADIFAGSNTTGHTAERLGRKWYSFELVKEYAAGSALRFADSAEEAQKYYDAVMNGEHIMISERQLSMFIG